MQKAFNVKNPDVSDLEIIEWCRKRDAVWWTTDLKAQNQYKEKLSEIPAVWIQQPKGGLLKRQFFLRIVWHLERVLTALENGSGQHFRITEAGRFRVEK